MSAQSAPRIAAPRIISGTRLNTGSEPLADEGGGDGAGHELALGADVPELRPEGDDHGEPGEEERCRLHQRVLEVVGALEGGEEEDRIGLEDIRPGELDQRGAEDERDQHCAEWQQNLHMEGRRLAPFEPEPIMPPPPRRPWRADPLDGRFRRWHVGDDPPIHDRDAVREGEELLEVLG